MGLKKMNLNLAVKFNSKRNLYYIQLSTPFYEVNVYDKKITEEVVKKMEFKPYFFLNRLFEKSNYLYEDDDWNTSADFIDNILSFKGKIVFSGNSKIELYEREKENVKEQVAIVEHEQEDIYQDKRSYISGKCIYLVRGINILLNKDNYTEISESLLAEIHYLSSQKTAGNRLSDYVEDAELLDNDWKLINSVNFDYKF